MTELLFDEYEPGAGSYVSRTVVAPQNMRMDQPDDDSGYIIYNRISHSIYSVNHTDQTVFVIKGSSVATGAEMPGHYEEWLIDESIPRIESRPVYTYRGFSVKGKAADACVEAHIVPGLLTAAADMLFAYHQDLASQQADTIKQTPEEYLEPCMLIDKVFYPGIYYERGFPIQESHKDGISRILKSYKDFPIDERLFQLPSDYHYFSLGEKTPL